MHLRDNHKLGFESGDWVKLSLDIFIYSAEDSRLWSKVLVASREENPSQHVFSIVILSTSAFLTLGCSISDLLLSPHFISSHSQITRRRGEINHKRAKNHSGTLPWKETDVAFPPQLS